MSQDLNPTKALIFRIMHRDNVPWVLDNGLQCRNSQTVDPKFVTIGNPDLIDKRNGREVLCAPGGTLSDYVPFYFTPWSPMLLNILTGWRGLRKRGKDEIVILASSLHELDRNAVRYLFTDRHAYLATATYYSDLARLDQIDWAILRNRDFKRDPDDPDKFARYEAEALIYRIFPIGALLGMVCYNESVAEGLRAEVAKRDLNLKIAVKPNWYF